LSTISPTARETIKAHLEVFVENLVAEYKARAIPTLDNVDAYLAQKSAEGQMKPFHAAIVPPQLLRITEFERGFSTSLGSTFEKCAKIVAAEHHPHAEQGYALTGQMSLSAINEIEHQVAAFESAANSKEGRPSLAQMVQSVLDAHRDDDVEERTVWAGLHILRKDGTELFFEMKSPRPNKGQCLEVIQRILRLHLLRRMPRPKVQAYFAMAYNPFGPDRADYTWSFARNYLPFDEVVLLGDEFWSLVGDPSTYREVLAIYQEVGREKAKYMLDALAFGF